MILARAAVPFLLAAAALAQREPKTVEVIRPAAADVVRRLVLPATIAADLRTELRSPVAGFVRTMHVDLGTRIRAGDIVCELWQPAESQRPVLAAQLHAKEALHRAARAEAAAAAAAVAEPQRMLDRLRRAQGQSADIVADKDLDVAEAKLAEAAARAAVGEAAVAAALEEVALAQARQEELEAQLALGVIRAPFAGVVTERLVDLGAAVQPADRGGAASIAVVLRDERVRVRFDVPEADVRFLRPGTTALRIDVPALGDGASWPGTLARTAGGLEPTSRSLRAEADLPNDELRLRPGMFARVTLDLEERRGVLTVPSSALVEVKSKLFLLVIRDGLAHRVPVRVGADDGVRAEILDGVSATEAVLAMGRAAAADLEPVRAKSTAQEQR
jgi:RND family efflux transporter MFP subunit